MDKEQARFILQSFRPDGADAQDPDFAEALVVAARDRELGDWLAGERAEDAAFAEALAEVEIPEDLRASILSVLRGDRPEEDFAELDAAFIGALATVQPPEGLRQQIVSAMKVESGSATRAAEAKSAPRRASNWLKSAAVAAAVVLGAFVAIEITNDREAEADPITDAEGQPEVDQPNLERVVPAGHLTVRDLEYEFIRRVHEGALDLGMKERDLAKLNVFLAEHDGPTLAGKRLPRGLVDLSGVGCQVLKVRDSHASLVCFDADDQTVHLVVVRRQDLTKDEFAKLAGLEDVKADKDNCRQCPVTKVSVASWSDSESAFLLLGHTGADELRERFFY